jgi:hypothetical protein
LRFEHFGYNVDLDEHIGRDDHRNVDLDEHIRRDHHRNLDWDFDRRDNRYLDHRR